MNLGLPICDSLQDKKSTYAGPMEVVRKIVAKDGLLGLYAGMEATFWRYDPFFLLKQRYLITHIIKARLVEWRLLWLYLPGSGNAAQGRDQTGPDA
jgi:hypothetical protein